MYYNKFSLIILSATILVHEIGCIKKQHENIFSKIESKYQIKVRYHIDKTFFPGQWLKPPVSAKAGELGSDELKRFPLVLDFELSKYPIEMIKHNLSGIYLTKEIVFFNTSYGATSSNDIVYLNSKGKAAGYSDAYIAGTLHHEIAHILYYKHAFPDKNWKACNPKRFKYSGIEDGGRKAIKNGKDSLIGAERFYRQGFLNEYGTSSMEEDFCVFSEEIMYNPQRVLILIKNYPRLNKKFKIWLSFYNSVNNKFTMEYIRQIKK